jgi:hypothetical protein
MKKQKVRRLTLHRETIQKLDDNPSLRWLVGGEAGGSSQCSFVCCPVESDTCTTA